jgi:hypothetical protein
MTEKLNVIYIGDKPEKVDNVSGSGAVWRGYGEVQAVKPESWAKLSKHPNVWVLAGSEAVGGLSLASSPTAPDQAETQESADEAKVAPARKAKATTKVAPPTVPDQAED